VKICIGCGESKGLSCYGLDKRQDDGLKCYCKDCCSEQYYKSRYGGVRLIVCGFCGQSFKKFGRGRDPLYCKYCKENESVGCEECGKAIPLKHRIRFCSKKCVAKYYANRRGKTVFEKICPACGVVYPTVRKNQVYCSRGCGFAWRSRWKRSVRVCVFCGEKFEPTRKNQKCCGDECAKRQAHKAQRVNKTKKNCGLCGELFEVDGAHLWAKYCSKRCSDAATRGPRRVRRAELIDSAESDGYYREAIYSRDKWVCQICGKDVDRRLKWPNPNSSSLDHRIPISMGGDDTTDNVQLAHLGCNIRKGNRNIIAAECGQLMIV